MSSRVEAHELARRINETAGRTIAHPDVIVDSKFTSQDARKLRNIQQSWLKERYNSGKLIGGSG